MKLRKSILAVATASTVAFGGAAVANASDLPGSVATQKADEGTAGSLSFLGQSDNEAPAEGDDDATGSISVPDDALGIIGSVGTVASAVAAIIGLLKALNVPLPF